MSEKEGICDKKDTTWKQRRSIHSESEALTVCLQIVNPKGEMKGSAITGPVGKEAAELWPVSFASPTRPGASVANEYPAYRVQLRCRHVNCLSLGSWLELFSCTSHLACRQIHGHTWQNQESDSTSIK